MRVRRIMLARANGLLVLRFLVAYSKLSCQQRKEWAQRITSEQRLCCSRINTRTRRKINPRKLLASRSGVRVNEIPDKLIPLWECADQTSCELPLASCDYGQ